MSRQKILFDCGGGPRGLAEAMRQIQTGEKSALEKQFDAAADSVLFDAAIEIAFTDEQHAVCFGYIQKAAADHRNLVKGARTAMNMVLTDPLFGETLIQIRGAMKEVGLEAKDYDVTGPIVGVTASKARLIKLAAADLFPKIVIQGIDDGRGRKRPAPAPRAPSDVPSLELVG